MDPQPNPLTELLRLNPHAQAVHFDNPDKPTRIVVHLDEDNTHVPLTTPTNALPLPIAITHTNKIRTLVCPTEAWNPQDLHQACQNEPIQLGCQLQPEHGNWLGTAGAPVSWIDAQGTRHWGILSNWHVMHGNYNDVQYEQHQPTVQYPVCARLARSTPIDKDGTNLVDAAIADALIDGFHTIANQILELGTLAGQPETAQVGLAVCKSGRTTGKTYGTCTAVGASVRVGYDDFTALFEDQDVFAADEGEFSAPGDSGSLIACCASLHPTALLFAGNSVLTIGCPMRHVVNAFNLVFPFN